MAGLIYVPSFMPALDLNGDPIPGALLYTYSTETTVRQTAYTDATLTTPLPNPVVANASGVFPLIFAPDASTYSIVITTPAGAFLTAYDDVNVSTNATTANAALAISASNSAAQILAEIRALVPGGGGASVLQITNGAPTDFPALAPGTALIRADNNTVGAGFLLWALFPGAAAWVPLVSEAV